MKKILDYILNIVFLRHFRAKYKLYRLKSAIKTELVEEFLELLLDAMGLVFCVNKNFRKNIRDFKGRYLFKTKDNKIAVAAIFQNEKLTVEEKRIDNTNLTFIFKNPKAIMSFLTSSNPDILGAILTQDVVTDGNLNYMYKFTYMARHLQLMALGKL